MIGNDDVLAFGDLGLHRLSHTAPLANLRMSWSRVIGAPGIGHDLGNDVPVPSRDGEPLVRIWQELAAV